jgi:primosomal protein N' (replication factor Y)
VIIQTYNPDHPIIKDVMRHDYVAMFRQQLTERLKYHYPPYVRLVLLRLKHKDPELLNKAAAELAKNLRNVFGRRILGPEFPMVGRIMNYYIKHIMFKMERDSSTASLKAQLAEEIVKFQKIQGFTQVRVLTDVDPQ